MLGRAVMVKVGDCSAEINGADMPGHFIAQPIPNINPPRTSRLINANNSIPVGVMRTVHPPLRRLAREGGDALEDSGRLAIIAGSCYFNRCKKRAQAKPVSLFVPGALELSYTPDLAGSSL